MPSPVEAVPLRPAVVGSSLPGEEYTAIAIAAAVMMLTSLLFRKMAARHVYTKSKILGAGSRGRVYLASNRLTRDLVAIKQIHAHDESSKSVARVRHSTRQWCSAR